MTRDELLEKFIENDCWLISYAEGDWVKTMGCRNNRAFNQEFYQGNKIDWVLNNEDKVVLNIEFLKLTIDEYEKIFIKGTKSIIREEIADNENIVVKEKTQRQKMVDKFFNR